MTPERFEILAEAFGGDVARWPDAEREAAAALMAAEPGMAEVILARAGDLDVALSAYAAPRGAGDLADRIVASAPGRRAARWPGWLAPAGMGAGLAAACAAGVVLGTRLPAAPVPADDAAIVTALGDEDFSLYLDEDA